MQNDHLCRRTGGRKILDANIDVEVGGKMMWPGPYGKDQAVVWGKIAPGCWNVGR